MHSYTTLLGFHALSNIPISLDSEEDYLLAISDKDAHDETTTKNFTDFQQKTYMRELFGAIYKSTFFIKFSYHVFPSKIQPFFKILCNGEPLPLISHEVKLSPIFV